MNIRASQGPNAWIGDYVSWVSEDGEHVGSVDRVYTNRWYRVKCGVSLGIRTVPASIVTSIGREALGAAMLIGWLALGDYSKRLMKHRATRDNYAAYQRARDKALGAKHFASAPPSSGAEGEKR